MGAFARNFFITTAVLWVLAVEVYPDVFGIQMARIIQAYNREMTR